MQTIPPATPRTAPIGSIAGMAGGAPDTLAATDLQSRRIPAFSPAAIAARAEPDARASSPPHTRAHGRTGFPFPGPVRPQSLGVRDLTVAAAVR